MADKDKAEAEKAAAAKAAKEQRQRREYFGGGRPTFFDERPADQPEAWQVTAAINATFPGGPPQASEAEQPKPDTGKAQKDE